MRESRQPWPSPRVRLLTLLLATTLTLILAAPWCEPPAPGTPSVDRSRLTLEDGILKTRKGGAPYTGWVTESHRNGVLKSRTAYINGRKHGMSFGWHTNGVLQVQDRFAGGKPHGLHILWDREHRRVAEGLLVEGKYEGVYRKWHTNGNLAAEARFLHGAPDGLSRSWHENGKLKSRVVMRGGIPVDQAFWNSDGSERTKGGGEEAMALPGNRESSSASAKSGRPAG